MRLVLAFAVAIVGLSTFGVDGGRAQSSTILEKLRGADSQELLLGPTSAPRKSDDVRSLSVAPSSAPDANHVIGSGREISPAERQELLQNQTREGPSSEWGNRDRR